MKQLIFIIISILFNISIASTQNTGFIECTDDLNDLLKSKNKTDGTIELCTIAGTNDFLVVTLKNGAISSVSAKSVKGTKGCTMRPTTGPTIPIKDNTSAAKGKSGKGGSKSTATSKKVCYDVIYEYADGSTKHAILCDLFN